ncbi:MAG: glycosyltransferase family 2 protein [Candidatus Omnitrophica bacterium]|nr:glycosyltransferase family 2 protein [Candidatus Omnitrophota bacterium]MDD5652586.1 glycosyltransferase family 2 protein [Candidatus Omnitrophota bacterium]
MPGISVVVATYNSQSKILPLMKSLFAQGVLPLEVIVVDNASSDQTLKLLQENYPQIKLIKNSFNAGFAKAYNRGIKESRGDFVLALNDDIELQEHFLKKICSAAENDEKIAAIQPKVLQNSGKLIDTIGIKLSLLRRFYNRGYGEPDNEKYNCPGFIFGVSAAAALYRKKSLESVRQDGEYFDEDFFCIAEDIDLSWRLQKKGWRSFYCPQAVCIHLGGVSRKRGRFTQYLSMRNRYFMLLKNESIWGVLRLPFVFLIYDLWRNLYMLLTSPGYFLKASFEVLVLAPKMLKKRLLSPG